MRILLYFHPHGSTSWGQIVDGVKDIAAKADWHVQEVNVRPTHKNLQELRKFWDPVGAIIDAGAGADELSSADLNSFPVIFIDHDPKTLPRNAFSVCHDSAATAMLAAKELLSTGFSHFDDGGIVQKAVAGRDWTAERVGDDGQPECAAEGGREHIDTPLSPVRERIFNHLPVRMEPAEGRCQGRCHLLRGEAPLERVRGDDDLPIWTEALHQYKCTNLRKNPYLVRVYCSHL